MKIRQDYLVLKYTHQPLFQSDSILSIPQVLSVDNFKGGLDKQSTRRHLRYCIDIDYVATRRIRLYRSIGLFVWWRWPVCKTRPTHLQLQCTISDFNANLCSAPRWFIVKCSTADKWTGWKMPPMFTFRGVPVHPISQKSPAESTLDPVSCSGVKEPSLSKVSSSNFSRRRPVVECAEPYMLVSSFAWCI